MTSSAPPFRVLPRIDEGNRPFWTGGEHGTLNFLHCRNCDGILHPPTPICPVDHSKDLEWRAVSGRATVASYTVNHQPWMPGPPLPWIIAIVELVEAPSVRLTTQLVKCRPEDVAIDMAVQVCFEHHPAASEGEEAIWLPLFEPVSRPKAAGSNA